MRVTNRMMQREYVLKSDRDLPKEEQTIFILKGLSYDSLVALQSSMTPTMNIPGAAAGKGSEEWDRIMSTSTIGMVMSQGGIKMQYTILSEGLIDVLNLIDETTGDIIPYLKDDGGRHISTAKRKDWFAQWLPDDVRVEIANAISSASTLDEDSVKN